MPQAIAVTREIRDAVHRVVRGVVVLEDPSLIDLLLACLICRGHVLLNDVPGVGKTLLARALAAALGVTFGRVQFTPDLLPSDITGINFYDQRHNDFRFRPGPVFTHLLLADEVNRATPRTQAALLECMQESTVTVDGVTRELAQPFMVIATQNPIEMEGTFPLPEAQLDRFLMCLNIGYPTAAGEGEIVTRFLNREPLTEIAPVTDRTGLRDLWRAAASVKLAAPILDYIVALTRLTRTLDGVRLGASPRGTLYLARASQAIAALRGRTFVLPDDVQEVARPVLAHRLLLDLDAMTSGETGEQIVQTALARIPVPVMDQDEPQAVATQP